MAAKEFVDCRLDSLGFTRLKKTDEIYYRLDFKMFYEADGTYFWWLPNLIALSMRKKMRGNFWEMVKNFKRYIRKIDCEKLTFWVKTRPAASKPNPKWRTHRNIPKQRAIADYKDDVTHTRGLLALGWKLVNHHVLNSNHYCSDQIGGKKTLPLKSQCLKASKKPSSG